MRRFLAAVSVVLLAGCGTMPDAAAFDAPEGAGAAVVPSRSAKSYADALQVWRTAEDLNDWIGARFAYDTQRAMLLSETQRSKTGRLPVHRPDEFFASPTGVCVDLSRFAVETLRAIAPEAKPTYLMIEFAPASIAGNTLRLHWLASYRRDGKYYFFADSKRPGVIAGPYATTREFVDQYSTYRGREVVAYRELESYERKARSIATRQNRDERP